MDVDVVVSVGGDGDVRRGRGQAAGRTGRADAARTFAIARGSAMECAAILDALKLLGLTSEERYRRAGSLLERLVAMLTKLCR